MFINLTNHPSNLWSEVQTSSAAKFGEIVDLPFPAVDENADDKEISSLAKDYFGKIQELANGASCTVHVMGEMTFTFALVNLLKAAGITCVASTTKRDVTIMPDGTKQVAFHFCRFRKY